MLIDLLSNTPFYVYWIFFSLLFVGISQTKTRHVGLYRAFCIPLVLVFLSVYAIIHDFGIHLLSTSVWIAGIFIIIFINKIVKSQKEIEYSSLTQIFTISGSRIPLIMMMILFFTKYTVGAVTAMDLPILHAPVFIGIASSLYGIFSGMYFIRLFGLLSKMKR